MLEARTIGEIGINPSLFKVRAMVIDRALDYAQRLDNDGLEADLDKMERRRMRLVDHQATSSQKGGDRFRQVADLLLVSAELFLLEGQISAYSAEKLGRELGFDVPHPYKQTIDDTFGSIR